MTTLSRRELPHGGQQHLSGTFLFVLLLMWLMNAIKYPSDYSDTFKHLKYDTVVFFILFFSIACKGLYLVVWLVLLFVLHKLKGVSLVILSVQLL